MINNLFFICDYSNITQLLSYTLDGQLMIEKKKSTSLSTLNQPFAVDLQDHNLYVIDKTHISILKLPDLTLYSSWKLPDNEYTDRGLKVDGKNLYFTLLRQLEIFMYSTEGIQQKIFGSVKAGSGKNEFYYPL